MRIFEAIMADEISAPDGEIVDITSRKGKIVASILCEEDAEHITRKFVVSNNNTGPENSEFVMVKPFGPDKTWLYYWELVELDDTVEFSEFDALVDEVEAQLQAGRDALSDALDGYATGFEEFLKKFTDHVIEHHTPIFAKDETEVKEAQQDNADHADKENVQS